MMHLYKSRKFDRDDLNHKYKTLCTGEYGFPTVFETTKFGFQIQKSYTSLEYNVTCPDCLMLLIPKFEERLNKMKAILKKAQDELLEQPHKI